MTFETSFEINNILFTWHAPWHTSETNQSQRMLGNIVRNRHDKTISTKSEESE